MQQSIAKAHNSGNLRADTDRYTHDTETLAAVGVGASRLASLLLRARNAGQDKWGREIVLLLAHRIKRHKLSRDVAERVAFASLMEWLQPHCRSCHGASEIKRESGGTIQCHSCGGIGVHRYTDKERTAMCGVPYAGRIKLAHDDVTKEITVEVSGALYAVRIAGD